MRVFSSPPSQCRRLTAVNTGLYLPTKKDHSQPWAYFLGLGGPPDPPAAALFNPVVSMLFATGPVGCVGSDSLTSREGTLDSADSCV
jgi:hypothetical protein